MRKQSTSLFFVLLLAFATASSAQFGKIFDKLGGRGAPANESQIASGLKEALQIGSDRAVDLTGVTDGFFKNAAIRILLPEPIRKIEKGLRLAGMGSRLDEFELSMNRAAEKAAPAARSIFKDALLSMSFDDARKILTGPGYRRH